MFNRSKVQEIRSVVLCKTFTPNHPMLAIVKIPYKEYSWKERGVVLTFGHQPPPPNPEDSRDEGTLRLSVFQDKKAASKNTQEDS